MAKLSISVPDGLWNDARAADPDKNPSQLVQEALADRIASRTLRFAAEDEEDRARLAEIAENKRAQAIKLYQKGYWAGLELFEKWPFEVLDWASQLDFDLRRLTEEDEDWGEMFYPLGSVADDINEADGWRQGKLFQLGRDRALRDAWAAVVQNQGDDAPAGGNDQ